jgi:hypothetical protein
MILAYNNAKSVHMHVNNVQQRLATVHNVIPLSVYLTLIGVNVQYNDMKII